MGLNRDNGKENGNYRDYKGYIGIIVYIYIYIYILGLYRDNGKENGNYYLGFRVITPHNGESNGKENGKGHGTWV